MSRLLLWLLPLLADQPQSLPAWISWVAGTRTVTLSLTAGATSANGGWNFNGASHGDLTVTVPIGVKVVVDFVVNDASAPHSVGFVSPEESMPSSGDGVTFLAPGAFSAPFVRGLGRGQTQRFSFTADRAGGYWMFCGVPPHGVGGMWNHFVVSATAKGPSVRTAKRK
jgi:sulfocyanin